MGVSVFCSWVLGASSPIFFTWSLYISNCWCKFLQGTEHSHSEHNKKTCYKFKHCETVIHLRTGRCGIVMGYNQKDNLTAQRLLIRLDWLVFHSNMNFFSVNYAKNLLKIKYKTIAYIVIVYRYKMNMKTNKVPVCFPCHCLVISNIFWKKLTFNR